MSDSSRPDEDEEPEGVISRSGTGFGLNLESKSGQASESDIKLVLLIPVVPAVILLCHHVHCCRDKKIALLNSAIVHCRKFGFSAGCVQHRSDSSNKIELMNRCKNGKAIDVAGRRSFGGFLL